MSPFVESLIILAVILITARYIKRGSKLLQRFFIPSSLVAGVMGLLLGPQVFNFISVETVDFWAKLPKDLITVVFAGLFLGRVIPGRKEIWRLAGPQIAFGNTLAWGQYVVGGLLTLIILTPIFGTSPLAASLVEIGFEGGHGTAAGLAPTFEKFGWTAGTDIALAIATISIVTAIISGVLFINWHSRSRSKLINEEDYEHQRKQLVRSGYNLITLTEKFNANPKSIVINIGAFIVSIAIGWSLLKGLVLFEEWSLASFTDLRFFPYMPLFPLAMLGGLILQMLLRKLNKQTLIRRRTAETFSSIALDVLVASAIATVSLNTISDNLPVIIILSLAGIAWILFGFWVLAPRIFPTYWFEKGITNMGQSMGMTATGLLLQRLADPSNESKARESFAYKQLVFEPFMGGGIVTASSVIFIYEFGLVPVLIGSVVITAFWLVLGLSLGSKGRSAIAEKS